MVKPKLAVRSLATPLRMNDGMDADETPKKQQEVLDGPMLSERDKAKLERKKRKEERQREVKVQLACLDILRISKVALIIILSCYLYHLILYSMSEVA